MGLFDFFKRNLNKNISSINSINSHKKSDFANTTIQNNSIINPLLKKKMSNGLLPGEIILLNWISGKSEPFNFSKYFEYTYGLNANKTFLELDKKNYFKLSGLNETLLSYTAQQLKDFLKEKGLQNSGNKQKLIERLIPSLTDEDINKLKKVYALSELGEKVTKDYDYIIKAHHDKYFSVVDAIITKIKHPKIVLYGDLKWTFLNNEQLEQSINEDYGLYRNTLLAMSEQLAKENNISYAIYFLLCVQTIDCMGVANNFKNRKPCYENIMVAPGIIDRLNKYNQRIDDADYKNAFSQSLRRIDGLKTNGFLTKEDLKFLEKELRNPEQSTIEKYFKKYEDYTSENVYGF